MVLLEIPLEEIDFENERFRITEEIDSVQMLDSLRKIGQVNPVLLVEEKPPLKTIVCGFRRLRALKQLGRHQVFARILAGDDYVPVRVFELALWDNLSHRQLNPLEKARTLFSLMHTFGVARDTLTETYLPILGLNPHKSVLRTYLSLNSVHPHVRRCFNEGRLTLSSVEWLAGVPLPAQNRVALMMGKIRLSSSLQKDVFGLIGELAAMADTQLDELLNRPELLATVDDLRLSPFQKGEKVRELLYRWKNPRLSQAVERFMTEKEQLGLPSSIRITPDPFFETPRLRFEFDASSPERFREMVAALQKASNTSALEQLFYIS